MENSLLKLKDMLKKQRKQQKDIEKEIWWTKNEIRLIKKYIKEKRDKNE